MKRLVLVTYFSLLFLPFAFAQTDHAPHAEGGMPKHTKNHKHGQTAHHKKAAPQAPSVKAAPDKNARPAPNTPITPASDAQTPSVPATPVVSVPIEPAPEKTPTPIVNTTQGETTPDATNASPADTAEKELADIQTPPDQPMQFSFDSNDNNCNGCKWIIAEGNITPDTAKAFNTFIQDNNLLSDDNLAVEKTLVFHSNGGDLLAAMSLGHDIRSLGFNTAVAHFINNDEAKDDEGNELPPKKSTFVQGICKDACVWAFLGGNTRTLGQGILELQTYRPPLDGASTTSGQEVDVRKQQLIDIAYILDYAHQMNFTPHIAFINWQSANPHVFTAQEVDNFHINYDTSLLGPWELGVNGATIATDTKSDDGKSKAELFCSRAKKITLTMTKPTRLNDEQYNAMVSQITGFNVLGFAIPVASAKLTLKNGQIDASFILPKIVPTEFSISNAELTTNGLAPNSVDVFATHFSDMENLQIHAKIISNACH